MRGIHVFLFFVAQGLKNKNTWMVATSATMTDCEIRN